jgi:Cu+-exporting ATPase
MGVLADDRPAAQDGATQSTGLAIGAMTCASSAARVESKLNRLGSVTAAVNLATGRRW